MTWRAAATAVVACGLCLSILMAGCGPVPIPLAGEGEVATVSPSEGTIGTDIVITGANLGSAAGEVLIGTAKAQITSWSETEIKARVAGRLTAGDYDVTVKPWWEQPITFTGFGVREPQLVASEVHPRFMYGGETATVTGRFLGQISGTVSLQDRQGQRVSAEVSDWNGESVTFTVPTQLRGLWGLVVKNDVGEGIEGAWCSFEAQPAGAVVGSSNIIHKSKTREVQTGIQFNGDLWIFGPAGDDSALWGDRYINCESWGDAPDPPGKSHITPAPLVVDGFLWLFNTATDGTIEYFKYDSTGNKWSSAVKIPNAKTSDDLSVAAAYNNVSPYDRIEVFYYANNHLWRTYSDNRGGSWSTPAYIDSGDARDGAPGAVFWENAVYYDSTNKVSITVPFATVVAFSVGNGIKVAYVQDGQRVHEVKQTGNYSISGAHPTMVDLGEDYLALVCSDMNCQPAIRKLSKATGQWQSIWRPLSYDSNSPCWGTTGAVGVHKVADPASKGGYRYDTYFYLFWGKNDGGLFDDDYSAFEQLEYLGYYIEPNEPVASNFASDPDTFYLWPIIGIVDAPPFVSNGVDIAKQNCALFDCTQAMFGTETTQYLTVGGSYSVGPYIESGKHCPFQLEISAEVNQSINKETSWTKSRGDTLYRDMEGIVMAFYLTPEFRTHTYEWFNHGDTATGKYFYVQELVTMDLSAKTFDPRTLPVPGATYVSEPYWDSFPLHIAETDLERLGTYSTTYPSDQIFLSSSGDWGRAKDGEIAWSTSTKTETESGLDIQFKVGKEKVIGGGVEGSFTLHTSMSTELTAEAKVTLINADASDASRGDVESFHAIGYWLKMSDSGFWVPRNRLGMGDKPWFITYYVSATPYAGAP